MNNYPLVSILVPVYNVEKYIATCCESLFDQSYENIEYVFVNDCSIDKSENILLDSIHRFSNKRKNIKVICHRQNQGLAAARATGLEESVGEYVMFVDSDDYLNKDTVQLCIKKAISEKSDVVSFGFNHIYLNGKNFVSNPPKVESAREYLIQVLERRIGVNVCAKLFRRDLFIKSKVEFIKGINMGEDYVVASRILYFAKKISFIHLPLYNYVHFNPLSYTAALNRTNIDSLVKAEEIVRDFYIEKKDSDFIKSQIVGRLHLKAEMIILLFRQKKYKYEDYCIIRDLYKEYCSSKEFISKLKIQDQITLKLSGCNILPLLRIYVKVGYYIKQIFK